MKYHVFANDERGTVEHIWLNSHTEVLDLWRHAREWAFGFWVICPDGRVMQYTGGKRPKMQHRRFE